MLSSFFSFNIKNKEEIQEEEEEEKKHPYMAFEVERRIYILSASYDFYCFAGFELISSFCLQWEIFLN